MICYVEVIESRKVEDIVLALMSHEDHIDVIVNRLSLPMTGTGTGTSSR